MSDDTKTQLIPEQSPVYIGAGVLIEGKITHKGGTNERVVILGEFKGDIDWNGIIQVPHGGTLSSTNTINCRELVVAGSVIGKSIVTGVLHLRKSANVQVEEALLPPGGLEQERGSFFVGSLRMTAEHPFFDDAQSESQDDAWLEQATRPTSTAMASVVAAAAAITAMPTAVFSAGFDDVPTMD